MCLTALHNKVQQLLLDISLQFYLVRKLDRTEQTDHRQVYKKTTK